jgi:predicted negative regulator of RcsB-dependent stress response
MIGLAYIQMAENFVQLKNLPQAKIILQSILANSSDESMKVLAKKKIDEIQ